MNNEDRAVVKNYLQELLLEMRTLLERTTIAPGSEHYVESLKTTLDDIWNSVCVLVGPYPKEAEEAASYAIAEPAVESPPTVLVGCGRVRGRQPVPAPEPVPPGSYQSTTNASGSRYTTQQIRSFGVLDTDSD